MAKPQTTYEDWDLVTLGEIWILMGNRLANEAPSDFVKLVSEICSIDNDEENSFGALMTFGVDIAGGAYEPDEVEAILASAAEVIAEDSTTYAPYQEIE